LYHRYMKHHIPLFCAMTVLLGSMIVYYEHIQAHKFLYERDVLVAENNRLVNENKELLFQYKALTAEVARLNHEVGHYMIDDAAFSTSTSMLPYYVPPVDISEPLPYVEDY
jgi:hypothetical protein